MPKKMTPEERKAFGEKMKLAREAKKAEKAKEPKQDTTEHIAPEQGVDELKAQIQEMQANMKRMQEAMTVGTNAGTGKQTPQLNQQGTMIGEYEKYLVDPSLYPDPTPRLAEENRLQSIAFKHNYEMEYSVAVSSYRTQSGTYMKEPKFRIQLNRVVLDDQGEQTDKRYIARILTFHEDPEAALVIARENGLEVDRSNENKFLNEMRYYRVRDWLFSIFWPKPPETKGKIKEEVIGGSVVQVFTKSSEDASGIDFDKIDKKLVV